MAVADSQFVQYGPVYPISSIVQYIKHGSFYPIYPVCSSISSTYHYVQYMQYGPIYPVWSGQYILFIQHGPVWPSISSMCQYIKYVRYGPVYPICPVWSNIFSTDHRVHYCPVGNIHCGPLYPGWSIISTMIQYI